MSRRALTNLVLAGCAVAVVVLAAVLGGRASAANAGTFIGTDDAATAQARQLDPGYVPWAVPAFEPSPELESALFALLAVVGVAIMGVAIGRLSARRRAAGGVAPVPPGDAGTGV